MYSGQLISSLSGLAAFNSNGINTSASRHTRRIYVGNLKAQLSDTAIRTFFNNMVALGLSGYETKAVDANGDAFAVTSSLALGPPVVWIDLVNEKNFAFVEFRTPELATAALDLDRFMFDGKPLLIRRPSDYPISASPSTVDLVLDVAKIGMDDQVITSNDKLFIGGLPYDLSETDVKALFEPFGQIKVIHLIMQTEANSGPGYDPNQSQGFGFLEFEDSGVIEAACSMNGVQVGERVLAVRKAKITLKGGKDKPILQPPQQPPAPVIDLEKGIIPLQINPFDVPAVLQQPSKVLCLVAMVDINELKDNKEYAEIQEDIQEECNRFGRVLNLVIPRPTEFGNPVAGLGKVFVEFSSVDQCIAAKRGLEGRKFGERTVVATYYPDGHFQKRVLF